MSNSSLTNKSDGSEYGAHLFTFSGGHKAGMDGMDKEKQAKVIYEMSKNTSYFKRAQEQNRKTVEKVKEMKNKLDRTGERDLKKYTINATKEVECLETKRNFGNICCVLDMDMFFAAVEIRDRPELKDKPVAIGNSHMISTSNYVARKYGVRAAMPGFIGKRLCPELVFVDANFKKYEFVGEQIRSVVKEYDPHFRSFSLDEVYMDLTAVCRSRIMSLLKLQRSESSTDLSSVVMVNPHNNPDQQKASQRGKHGHDQFQLPELWHMAIQVTNEIRARITEITGGLTCSAGIAHNFLLAKIGADVNKPNGQFSLQPNENSVSSQLFECNIRKPPTRESTLEFVHSLPCRKIGGIGKVMDNTLKGLGYATMGDVYRHIGEIMLLFPGASGKFLLSSCVGMDSYEVKSHEDVSKHATNRGGSSIFGFVSADQSESKGTDSGARKSISVSRTFTGTRDQSILKVKLQDICEKVAVDMKKESLAGRTVTLTIKNSQFQSFSRCVSATVAHSTSFKYIRSANEIFEYALPLLTSMLPMTLRLIGVSISKFEGSGGGGTTNPLNQYFKKNADGVYDTSVVAGQSKRQGEADLGCSVNHCCNASNKDIRVSCPSDLDEEVNPAESEFDADCPAVDAVNDYVSSCSSANLNADMVSCSTSDSVPLSDLVAPSLVHNNSSKAPTDARSQKRCSISDIADSKRQKISPACASPRYTDHDNSLLSSVQEVVCPICDRVLNDTNTTYTVINLHIDMCIQKKLGKANSIYNRYFAQL